ncbi:MAG: hypothetical protein RJB11_3084, partial [Planctomycetota bacterium]
MNLLSLIPRFLAVLVCLPALLVAQSTERLGKDFPHLAKSLNEGNPAAIKTAFEQLSPQDRQRVLTVFHAQRISPVGVSSGSYAQPASPSGIFSGPAGEGGAAGGGAAGGGAIANFSELMRLIETTISPDGWQSAGGTATMSPFRQGVRITTDGLIERIS